jgi:SAM-dependent methyltransferase
MSNISQQLVELINVIFVPIRLAIPQPILSKIPVLRTNEEERCYRTLAEYHGVALDIGCGANGVIKHYRRAGNQGTGVDVYGWEGPDLIVPDSAHLPFESRSFDTISFVACLNHIPNRVDVLKEARRLLKQDGRVLITNLRPWVSRIWHKIAFWDPDQHERGMKDGEVFGFSDRALIEILDGAGFALVKRVGFMWGLNHLYVFELKRSSNSKEPV